MLFKNANNTNNNGEHTFVDKLEHYRSIRMVGNGIIQPLSGQQVRNLLALFVAAYTNANTACSVVIIKLYSGFVGIQRISALM